MPKLPGMYDHFCVYFSFSVLFLQELVAVTFLFSFLGMSLQVAVACFVHTAVNHLKIYVCDSYHSLHSWVQSLFEKALRVIFSQEFSGIRLK